MRIMNHHHDTSTFVSSLSSVGFGLLSLLMSLPWVALLGISVSFATPLLLERMRQRSGAAAKDALIAEQRAQIGALLARLEILAGRITKD